MANPALREMELHNEAVDQLNRVVSEPSKSAVVPMEMPTDQLGGKTPWEFACMWYQPGQIAYSIARSNAGFGSYAIESAMGQSSRIPKDVLSQEFAEWLTEQYRLAMAKGIEIGQRSRAGS